MNPNLCRVVLRPRGPFELVDLALRLSRVRWAPLATLCGGMIGPLVPVCIGLCWLFEGHWGLLALPFFLGPVLQAPVTLLVGRMLFADEVSLAEVLRDVLRRAPSLVVAWAAFAMGLLASGITCFYGAPFVQGALIFFTETTLLEQVGLSRAANRSLRLAGASAGQTLAGLAVRWGSALWFAVASESLGQAVVGFVLQLGEPFGSAWAGQVTPYLLVGLLLSHPFWALYRLLLYVDVRTRTEGWDLQVALRAAGLKA